MVPVLIFGCDRYDEVVPQFVSSRSVGELISTIFHLGLMNGGYIELVFVGIINQQTYLGGAPPCMMNYHMYDHNCQRLPS